MSTDIAVQENELANRRLEGGLAEGNGVIDPARWQMLAAIAETVAETEFVPVGLRGSSKKVLACLLYGDSLSLHPMTSLKEIYVIDGTPGLSAACMAALVRKANPGHRMRREELRDEENRFLGVKAFAERGDTGEVDEYTFTLQMAARANLMGKHNWKSYPEAMCTARAYSQLCTFLFPDVFMGSPLMPEELEGVEPTGGGEGGGNGHVAVHPPKAPEAPEEPVGEAGEPSDRQLAWEIKTEEGELVATVTGSDREAIRVGAAEGSKVVRLEGADYEIVGYEVNGETSLETIVVRLKKAAPAPAAEKPAEGSPPAVVKESIPKVFEYVSAARERGDRAFIEGILAAELEGKKRQRLIDTLNDTIREMAKQEIEEGGNPLDELEPAEANDAEATDAEAPDAEAPDAETREPVAEGGFQPLPPEPELVPEPEAQPTDELLLEVDPEIPYTSLTKRAKEIRLAALCAYMEDQHPSERSWHLAGVIGAASRQWGITAHALEDLDDDQLEKIWQAAEQYATAGVEFLALLSPADVVKLAEGK